jgi:hypothetical protein
MNTDFFGGRKCFQRPSLPHGPFTVKIREIGDLTQRPPNFVALELFGARPQGRLRSRER